MATATAKIIAAWLTIAGMALGQISVPAEVEPFEPIVATCQVPTAGESQVLWTSSAVYVQVDPVTLHVWAAPGKHSLEAIVISIDWDAKRFTTAKHVASFKVTGAVPDVPPEPVDPDVPPKPPVPVGKLTAIIVHESEDNTAATSRMFVALRTGESAQYLKSKGHKLLILDDDSTDEHGNPLNIVAPLKSLGLNTPALFILNEKGNVVAKKELPAATTAQNVVEYIRQAGG